MVMVLLLSLTDLAIFFMARARAQTAADAAALAAAAEMIPGSRGSAETEARKYAALNGGRVIYCECAQGSGSATVFVSTPVRFGLLALVGPKEVGARAKAEVDLGGLSCKSPAGG